MKVRRESGNRVEVWGCLLGMKYKERSREKNNKNRNKKLNKFHVKKIKYTQEKKKVKLYVREL